MSELGNADAPGTGYHEHGLNYSSGDSPAKKKRICLLPPVPTESAAARVAPETAARAADAESGRKRRSPFEDMSNLAQRPRAIARSVAGEDAPAETQSREREREGIFIRL